MTAIHIDARICEGEGTCLSFVPAGAFYVAQMDTTAVITPTVRSMVSLFISILIPLDDESAAPSHEPPSSCPSLILTLPPSGATFPSRSRPQTTRYSALKLPRFRIECCSLIRTVFALITNNSN